jgi:hypothetical protein
MGMKTDTKALIELSPKTFSRQMKYVASMFHRMTMARMMKGIEDK